MVYIPTLLAVCWILALIGLADLVLRVIEFGRIKAITTRRVTAILAAGIIGHVLIMASFWFTLFAVTYWIAA